VVLVDDHEVVRDGLRSLLERQPDIEVAGDAGNGHAALEVTGRVRPDVVVLDIELPDLDGVVLAQKILSRWPDTRIVIFAGVVDRAHLDDALRAGVSGIVLKLNATSELVQAIRRVSFGEMYVSAEVSATLAGSYRDLLCKVPGSDPVLSEREVDVLKRIAAGRNTKEIAGELGLSTKTIETHRARIMSRLGLHSVAELTKYAIRKGLASV